MSSLRNVIQTDCGGNHSTAIFTPPTEPTEHGVDTVAPAGESNGASGVTRTQARAGIRSTRRPLVTVTTADFLEEEFPEPTWTVDEMLSAGVSVIGGAPKIGKSWLVLQLAHAVATGTQFLGQDVDQGGVLVLVLEGNKSFFQERVRKVLRDDRPTNIHLAFDSDRLHSGLEDQIDDFLTGYPGTKLVIVDTLVRVHPRRASGRTQYQDDAATLRGMELLSRSHPEVAFLFVHHTREMDADDPLDALSGSRGLTGTIENGWILGKPKGVATPVLQTSGRNLPEPKKLAVEFDLETCLWSLKGDARKYPTGRTRRAIIEYLEQAGAEGSTSGDITKNIVETTGAQGSSVRKTLTRMCDAGQVQRTDGGVYKAAT